MHHTLLHRNANDAHDSAQPPPGSYHCLTQNLTTTVLLPTTIVKVQDTNGNIQEARALWDTGSMANSTSEGCARRLVLKLNLQSVPIDGIDGAMSHGSKSVVKCLVKSGFDNSACFNFDAIFVPKVCFCQPRTLVDHSQWSHVTHLKLADMFCYKPTVIDILIGAEMLPYLLSI